MFMQPKVRQLEARLKEHGVLYALIHKSERAYIFASAKERSEYEDRNPERVLDSIHQTVLNSADIAALFTDYKARLAFYLG